MQKKRGYLKKGSSHFIGEQQIRYLFIQNNNGYFRVGKLCKQMNISVKSYYNWLKTKDVCSQKQATLYLKTQIKVLFNENRQVYGSIRIQKSIRKRRLVL